MKRVILFLLSSIVYSYSFQSFSQEFAINVTIDATQIPDMQPSVTTDMKQAITRFINDRKWTNDDYQQNEKIRGNFAISLTGQPSPYTYTATLQVQLTRPVYGTSYETILINFFDKNFNFDLQVGQPLNYNDNTFTSNLTAMIAFYANVMLALDYDSFGKLSGQQYVEKAYSIANISVEAGGGWLTTGDPNNRFSLIDNLNSQLMLPFRENFYNYHRLALDTYLKDPVASRAKIIDMLTATKGVVKVKPYSILIRSFFLAKRDELINIFRDANTDQKTAAVNMLRELDPLNSEKYGNLLK
jgi:hypothetical protein